MHEDPTRGHYRGPDVVHTATSGNTDSTDPVTVTFIDGTETTCRPLYRPLTSEMGAPGVV